MNALNALRSLAYPALRTDSIPKAGADSVTPAAIPFAELEKIAPDFATQLPGQSGVQGASFDQILGRLATDVTQQQTAAGDSVRGLISGQNVSLHQTMISMEEASVSFQLMVEVRNKLLESYQELMRLQI